jgi:hypothetical protein
LQGLGAGQSKQKSNNSSICGDENENVPDWAIQPGEGERSVGDRSYLGKERGQGTEGSRTGEEEKKKEEAEIGGT